MKRVLITGGSGFLGARILQQGLGMQSFAACPRLSGSSRGGRSDRDHSETTACGHCARGGSVGHRLLRTAPGGSPSCQRGAAGLGGKAACASGAKLLAFSSDQVYAGITQPGPLPETCPCSRPMYMAAANWKWNSVCWNSARTLCCCGPAGCMTCRATGCPSGATCR